jgi:hypothetical protein
MGVHGHGQGCRCGGIGIGIGIRKMEAYVKGRGHRGGMEAPRRVGVHIPV